MFVKWNISKNNLEFGLEKLKNVTYPQKKYCQQVTIEKSYPISRFKFYGVVSEKFFTISPVVLGLNRVAAVLYGTVEKSNIEAKLTIKVKPQPFDRFVLAISVFCVFCLCGCFPAAVATGDYRVVGGTLLTMAMGILMRVVVEKIIGKQIETSLSILQDIFNPDNV